RIQLIDCPELGYLTSDKPNPRGEIVAHTTRITPGYYGVTDDEIKDKFINIGGIRFFRTGDIGEMEDGKIRVIDRRNAIFKLSQGTSLFSFQRTLLNCLKGVFVAPDPLENLYTTSKLVSQAFIFGNGYMSSVAIVIVPTS